MDFVSFQDLFRAGRDEALIRNSTLSDTVVEREGTDANVLIAAAAAAADQVTQQLIIVAASIFLDSATGQDLDRRVIDLTGLLRKQAAPAIGEVAFTPLTKPLAGFTVPAGLSLKSTQGNFFHTTQDTIFPLGSVLPVIAPVSSILAGANQQTAPNSITTIVDALPNAVGLTVTNPLATAGAGDAESDTSYRNRARNFFSTVQRGTTAAIIQGALAVPGVETASAIEVLDGSGRPNRFVQLIIADAFTPLLINVPTTTSSGTRYFHQSQQLSKTVFSALSEYRAAGINVDVIVASVVLLPVSLQLRYLGGFDPQTTALAARAQMVNYINSLKPGENFDNTTALAALLSVSGLDGGGTQILSPTAPGVTVQVLQVLRSTMDQVQVSVSESSLGVSNVTAINGVTGGGFIFPFGVFGVS